MNSQYVFRTCPKFLGLYKNLGALNTKTVQVYSSYCEEAHSNEDWLSLSFLSLSL